MSLPLEKPTQRPPVEIRILPLKVDVTYQRPEFIKMASSFYKGAFSEEWETVIKNMKRCQQCCVRQEAVNVVTPEYNLDAEIVMQGRNPGGQEDKTGRPFVPTAPGGKWFMKYLEKLGLKRNDIYITNSLLCHTNLDRMPVMKELVTCALWKAIEYDRLKKAKYFFLLGNDAIRQTFNYDFPSIVRIFGNIYQGTMFGRKVMFFPCYHPMFAGRYPDTLAIDQFSFLATSRTLIEEDKKGNLNWVI